MKRLILFSCLVISAFVCANQGLKEQLEKFEVELLLAPSYRECWSPMDDIICQVERKEYQEAAYWMGGVRQMLKERSDLYSVRFTDERAAVFARRAAGRARTLHRQLRKAAQAQVVVQAQATRKKKSGLRRVHSNNTRNKAVKNNENP